MSSIVVCGGGLVGVSTAVMLARDGHQVTLLETNPEPPPPDPTTAWSGWKRNGVAQFRQPHILLPGFRETLHQELPDLLDQLHRAGCVSRSLVDPLPPAIADRRPLPGDDRLQNLTGRRPVIEAVFALAAEAEEGLTVRRGVKVAGLLTGDPVRPDAPHVSGVRTTDGEELPADLVVDATGRRTASLDWLDEIGARKPQFEQEEHGFVYYSRYFAGPRVPMPRAPGITPIGSFSLLTIPSDNDTWSITIYGAARDQLLKKVRDPEVFDRLLRACPAHAHWLDGEPLTEVLPMAGISDSCRRFFSDGAPVVTGFAAVGDAWACTNPSAGRGLTIGLIHARALRATVRQWPDEPEAFQFSWDAITQQQLDPLYRQQLAVDRVRGEEIAALQNGGTPPEPEPLRARLLRTAAHDAYAFRAMIEMIGCLTLPSELFARAELLDGLDPLGPLPSGNGPDREQLEALLAS